MHARTSWVANLASAAVEEMVYRAAESSWKHRVMAEGKLAAGLTTLAGITMSKETCGTATSDAEVTGANYQMVGC